MIVSYYFYAVTALRSQASIDAIPKTSGATNMTTQKNAPVMYDEIASTGSSNIPLTQNSAYSSTNKNTSTGTDEHEYY